MHFQLGCHWFTTLVGLFFRLVVGVLLGEVLLKEGEVLLGRLAVGGTLSLGGGGRAAEGGLGGVELGELGGEVGGEGGDDGGGGGRELADGTGVGVGGLDVGVSECSQEGSHRSSPSRSCCHLLAPSTSFPFLHSTPKAAAHLGGDLVGLELVDVQVLDEVWPSATDLHIARLSFADGAARGCRSFLPGQHGPHSLLTGTGGRDRKGARKGGGGDALRLFQSAKHAIHCQRPSLADDSLRRAIPAGPPGVWWGAAARGSVWARWMLRLALGGGGNAQ